MKNNKKNEYDIKPDIAATRVYSKMAKHTLAILHGNQLVLLEKGLNQLEGPKSLFVVGPGRDVLPLSRNKDWLVKNLENGNLVLMDYNPDICDEAKINLENTNLKENFSIERLASCENECPIINPNEGSNRILIQHGDIFYGVPLTPRSISAIDMTLSVHHATVYKCDLNRILSSAYDALVPGGFLHIGEGDVDMKYSEKKVNQIATDLSEIIDEVVLLYDLRYYGATHGKLYSFTPNGKKEAIKETPSSRNVGTIVKICEDASVEIKYNGPKNLKKELVSKGYDKITGKENEIKMPLIDKDNKEDFEGLVVPVREYYKNLIEDCITRLPKEYTESFLEALTKECNDAEKGIVEYYSSPTMVINNLKKIGFEIVEVRYHKTAPLINILAKKT